MADLTDTELDEIIGDGGCAHLSFVRMALELRRHRATMVRLVAFTAMLERNGYLRYAAELRKRLEGAPVDADEARNTPEPEETK
jgi:hypothetical protein